VIDRKSPSLSLLLRGSAYATFCIECIRSSPAPQVPRAKKSRSPIPRLSGFVISLVPGVGFARPMFEPGARVAGLLRDPLLHTKLSGFVATLSAVATSAVCACGSTRRGCTTRWVVEYDRELITRFGLGHWCGIYCERSLTLVPAKVPPAPVLQGVLRSVHAAPCAPSRGPRPARLCMLPIAGPPRGMPVALRD